MDTSNFDEFDESFDINSTPDVSVNDQNRFSEWSTGS